LRKILKSSSFTKYATTEEIDRYLAEPKNFDEDSIANGDQTFRWWLDHKTQYPKLFQLALVCSYFSDLFGINY
jgi:hypothetical protein